MRPRWSRPSRTAGTTPALGDVETRATAIRIGNPVNAPKALPGIRETGGTAVAVSDEEITEAQRDLAGRRRRRRTGVRRLRRRPPETPARGRGRCDESVVCLTTGHLLKDPEAAAEAGNEPEPVANSTEAVLDLIEEPSSVTETIRRQASKAADAPLVPALVASGLGVAYLYRKLRSKK